MMKWIGTLVLAAVAVAFAAEDAQARGGRCGGGRGGCGGGGFVSHGGCGGQVVQGWGWQGQGYVVYGQPSCGMSCNVVGCSPAVNTGVRLSPPPTGSGPPQYVTPPVLVAPKQ